MQTTKSPDIEPARLLFIANVAAMFKRKDKTSHSELTLEVRVNIDQPAKRSLANFLWTLLVALAGMLL